MLFHCENALQITFRAFLLKCLKSFLRGQKWLLIWNRHLFATGPVCISGSSKKFSHLNSRQGKRRNASRLFGSSTPLTKSANRERAFSLDGNGSRDTARSDPHDCGSADCSRVHRLPVTHATFLTPPSHPPAFLSRPCRIFLDCEEKKHVHGGVSMIRSFTHRSPVDRAMIRNQKQTTCNIAFLQICSEQLEKNCSRWCKCSRLLRVRWKVFVILFNRMKLTLSAR